MNRLAAPALASLLVLLSAAGCTMPVGVSSDRAASVAHPRPHTRSNPVRDETRDTGPVRHLRVNSETLGADELWRGMQQELSDKGKTLGADAYRSYVDRLGFQLMTDRIAEMLLYQQASLRLSPEVDKNINRYVDGEIRKIITAEHGGVQRRYERHLAEQGLTIDDVYDELRRKIVIASYLDREVKPRIAEPTRSELLTMFEAHRDQWRRPERRSMSLIDVRVLEYLPDGVEDPAREEYDAARAEARSAIHAIEVELRNGADFADLARRYSHGLHAAEGGSWGFISRGSVRERFAPAVDALYQLDEGEVSPIIEVADGFLLVRCNELQPAVEPAFPDVQLEIKERYLLASHSRLMSELVEDLRRKARIEPASLERFHAAVVEAAMKFREREAR